MSKEEIITKNVDYKRVAKFALFGAIGFSVGGILGLLIGDALSQPGDLSFSYLTVPPSTGLIGGAMLGAALRKWSKVIALALLGALGFLGGVFIAISGAFQFSYPGPEALYMGIFIVMGAMGGGAIGIGLMRWRPFLGLALAGALGGLIGGAINLYTSYNLWLHIILAGIIGGALLGAALGFLEKGEKEPVKEPVTAKEGEGETFNYSTNKCPYCNSPIIEGGVIYRVKTDKERKTLGYSTKWQRVCLKCKSKWIAVEK